MKRNQVWVVKTHENSDTTPQNLKISNEVKTAIASYIVLDTWYNENGLQIEIIHNSLSELLEMYPDLIISGPPGFDSIRRIEFRDALVNPIELPKHTITTYSVTLEADNKKYSAIEFVPDIDQKGVIMVQTYENDIVGESTIQRLRHRIDFFI